MNGLLVLKILILFVNLTYHQAKPEQQPYYCDSESEIEQLKDIRNFYTHNGRVNLVLRNKTISFDYPFYDQIEGRQLFIRKQPFVEYHNESAKYEKIYGHFEFIAAPRFNRTYQFIKTNDSYASHLIAGRLIEDQHIGMINNRVQYLLKYKGASFVTIHVSTKNDYFELTDYNGQRKAIFVDSINDLGKLDSVKPFWAPTYKPVRGHIKFSVSYLTKVTYDHPLNRGYINIFKENEENIIMLIEMHDDHDTVDLTFQRFDYRPFKPVHEHRDMLLNEFLTCLRPLKTPNDLKGIFYLKSYFFIIINNFYLQIDSDQLIANNFEIDDSEYQKAKRFKFENEATLRSIDFEISATKWIKHYKNKVYFVMMNRLFDIKFNEKDNSLLFIEKNATFATETEIKEYFFRGCLGQLLEVDEQCFCLDGKGYWMSFAGSLNPDHIKDIFGPDLYDDDQQLELIFKYGDRTIFMTRTHTFSVDSKSIKINYFTEKFGYLLYLDEGTKVEKKSNYLFRSYNTMIEQSAHRTLTVVLILILVTMIAFFSFYVYKSANKAKVLDQEPILLDHRWQTT